MNFHLFYWAEGVSGISLDSKCHKLVYFKEDLTRNIMCLYSSEIRQLSYT